MAVRSFIGFVWKKQADVYSRFFLDCLVSAPLRHLYPELLWAFASIKSSHAVNLNKWHVDLLEGDNELTKPYCTFSN